MLTALSSMLTLPSMLTPALRCFAPTFRARCFAQATLWLPPPIRWPPTRRRRRRLRPTAIVAAARVPMRVRGRRARGIVSTAHSSTRRGDKSAPSANARARAGGRVHVRARPRPRLQPLVPPCPTPLPLTPCPAPAHHLSLLPARRSQPPVLRRVGHGASSHPHRALRPPRQRPELRLEHHVLQLLPYALHWRIIAAAAAELRHGA